MFRLVSSVKGWAKLRSRLTGLILRHLGSARLTSSVHYRNPTYVFIVVLSFTRFQSDNFWQVLRPYDKMLVFHVFPHRSDKVVMKGYHEGLSWVSFFASFDASQLDDESKNGVHHFSGRTKGALHPDCVVQCRVEWCYFSSCCWPIGMLTVWMESCQKAEMVSSSAMMTCQIMYDATFGFAICSVHMVFYCTIQYIYIVP